MIAAVGLLAAAGVLGFLAPRWLDRLADPRRDPRVALGAWLASQAMFVGVIAAVPIVLWVRPGERWHILPSATLVCAQSLRESGTVPWFFVLEAAICAAALAAIVRIVVVVSRRLLRYRRITDEHAWTLRLVGRRDPAEADDVYHLHGHRFAAYSIGGREPAIALGTGLASLAPGARDAVLAHERAHLRGRHHALVAWADALAAALSIVPLARVGAIWIRILVELSADRHAAAMCGPGAVCDALGSCSGAGRSGSMPTGSHLEDRAAWLAAARVPHRGMRCVHYPLALTVSALPVLVSVSSVMAAFVAYCAVRSG